MQVAKRVALVSQSFEVPEDDHEEELERVGVAEACRLMFGVIAPLLVFLVEVDMARPLAQGRGTCISAVQDAVSRALT